MTGSASDPHEPPDIVEAERDDHETRMTFGPGKVPIYVVLAWAGLLVAYFIYMVAYALPDLKTW